MKDKVMNSLFSVFTNQAHFCLFQQDIANGKCECVGNGLQDLVFPGYNTDSDLIDLLMANEAVVVKNRPQFMRFLDLLHRTKTFPYEGNLFYETYIQVNTDSKPILARLGIVGNKNDDNILTDLVSYITSIPDELHRNENPEAGSAPDGPRPQGQFDAAKVMRTMATTKENYAIVEFDIKRFKLINEKFGEGIGDEVLKNILVKLPEVWGRDGVFAKLGADIFVVFSEYSDIEELESRIDSIKTGLSSFGSVKYDFVFGVYLVEDRSIPLRKMVDSAALARRIDRENVLNDVKYYDERLGDDLHFKDKIESEMRNAIESGQFEVYIQPIYDIENNKIIGGEALSRWNYPDEGFLTPAWFIPIFEQDGFIEELDKYVQEQVCKLLKSWKDAGKELVPLSTNVSTYYLKKEYLVEDLNALTAKYDIDKSFFLLEFDENVNDPELENAIQVLKENDYPLMADNFGSGKTSLNVLAKSYYGFVKLDRVFIQEAMASQRGQRLLKYVIDILKELELNFSAAGIETEEQRDFLLECGCKVGQGYYYSKPVSCDDFERLLFG